MKILLKFGIGADSSTFGLPRFAMPRYEMGVFKTGVFKAGKIKTGFAENLGHCSNILLQHPVGKCTQVETFFLSFLLLRKIFYVV